MEIQTRIFPNDVLEILSSNGSMKRSELANVLDCSTSTISRKINRLIKDGENIGFNHHGLFIVKSGDIDNINNADLALDWHQRICNSLVMWAKRGGNNKRVAIEARKLLRSNLSIEERKSLKQQLLLTTRVLDAIALDAELIE